MIDIVGTNNFKNLKSLRIMKKSCKEPCKKDVLSLGYLHYVGY